MNYILTISTALLLAINITAPLHAAAARFYAPARQVYLQSTQVLPTLSPSTYKTFNTALQRSRLMSTYSSAKDKNSSSVFDLSTNYLSNLLTTVKHKGDMQTCKFIPGNLNEEPKPEHLKISVGLASPFMQRQWYDATAWYKLVNHALETSPQEYLELFSKNFNAPVESDVWQKFLLADLEERITPQNAPSLAKVLFSNKLNILLINNAAKSLIFKTLKQNKEAAYNIVVSVKNDNIHELLTKPEGKELLAEVMDPEIAMRITEKIIENPELYAMYADAALFKVISKILKTVPDASSNLIEPLGKALNEPFSFSTALALQLVRAHPETNRELYPYVKENLPRIINLADRWNDMLLIREDVTSTLGTENRALELVNTMLQNVPEAQHDFYSIITNHPDLIQSQSPAVKALIANIQKVERPRIAKDACKTALGLATAGGIGYGLYKAYGEDEQAGSRVQE